MRFLYYSLILFIIIHTLESKSESNAIKLLKRIESLYRLDQSHALLGIFTDGDLRRAIDRRDDLHNTNMSDLMIKNPITVCDDMLAAQAMKIIEDNNISCLAVTAENNIVLGVVHLHALIKAGLV